MKQLDEKAARYIVDVISANERPVLGLATGSTPLGVYSSLITAYQQGQVSFKQTTTFNLDEYVGLPSSHEQSYAHYMQKHLFEHVDMEPNAIHIPNGMNADPQQECNLYDKQLEKAGRIDIQILGLGHNGHIGFNEPDQALIRNTHVVELSETTIAANARFFTSRDEVPKQAITMGIGSILHAKQILLIVKGEDKAHIVHKSLCGPITTQIPASLLQTHPGLIVLLDRGAAKNLNL